MARFDIISKDGSVVRYSGKPRYNGAYLKPSYLEFSEIASPTPIAWEVGDYVDYSRTGMRYYLYSVPQASKNARKGSHGRAFTYTNIQFFAATKELEIALFRDLVGADNNIHFSSSPDVSTFENVEGIARRIQACMDDFYPGRWEVRIADFDATADAEIIKKIGEAKEFALSGGTCLDALSKIYELWQDIGWVHTYEGGKEVIIIGYPNKRIDENTTDTFLYGKGNGLTAIKKNQTNKEEFATRLYVYGSERNLPPRYYNGKDILNAESVDIRNLMIPLDSWGKTDGLPDARKAYLENAEAVAKYGVIPKTHYFDSDDAGADIYPTIEGMTIGQIRKALSDLGQTDYYPSSVIYKDDSERVDKILSVVNPSDDGAISKKGQSFEISEYIIFTEATLGNPYSDDILFGTGDLSIGTSGYGKVSIIPSGVTYKISAPGATNVAVSCVLSDAYSVQNRSNTVTTKVVAKNNGDYWYAEFPRMAITFKKETSKCPVVLFASFSADATIESITRTQGGIKVGFNTVLNNTFSLSLKQIGFDIEERAAQGKGKVVSMKSGMCEGRNFVISECKYVASTDSWNLVCKRQQDNTLGLVFPNKDYQIVAGDEFVLLDIAMPELYVLANSQKLLSEGEKLLARASKIQSIYEPSIDAKVMAESGRVLREGMFMEIKDEDVVDNITDYILIDTLSISEDESSIPTYKVTLKERRKVTYKGTPSATSATETESVEDEATSNTEVDVDLSNYYTKEEVDTEIGGVSKEIDTVADLLTSMWRIEGNKIVTDMDVLIKANLIIEGDTSSGGEGQDTPASGIRGIYVNGTPYTDEDGDGFIDLGTISGGSGVSGDYLPLAGGILNGSLQVGQSDNTGYKDISVVRNGVTTYMATSAAGEGYFGAVFANGNSAGFVLADGVPRYEYNNSYYTLIHSGNIASQSVSHATTTNRFKVLLEATSGDLNTALAAGGIARNYNGGLSQYTNAPSGASFGMVLELRGSVASSLAGQLAWDINHGSTSDVTRYLWWRASDSSNGFKYGKWHQIAFTDSNVASATKLATARTIWGQSFDGTGDVGGSLTGTNFLLMDRASNPYLKFTDNGLNGFIQFLGGTIAMGPTLTNSLLVNNNGNVGIGTVELYAANKLRLVNTHPHQHTWSLGYLAQESDFSVEFKNTSDGGVYGLYTSINYYTGHVAMQVGRSDGLTNVYNLLLQPLGGYVGIGTYDPRYTLDVNGDSRINGNLVVSGDTSSGSDIRFKDIIKNKTIKIADIAKAPLFTFRWNDRDDDTIHLGSSAQYWEKVTPWLVNGEDFKSLNYATLGVAMGISLAKKAVNHEERIKELEREIKRLKEEMRYGDR